MYRCKFISLILSLMLCMGIFNACASAEDRVAGLDLKELEGQSAVDLRDKTLTVEQYRLLKDRLPECEILWNVPFQGVDYSSDICELTVTTLSEADFETLALFPKLERIDAPDCPDYTVLAKLAAERPDLQVSYHIPFCGESISCDATVLTIPGDRVEEAAKLLPLFREVTAVTFAEPLPEAQQITTLQAEFPEIAFSWNLTFHEIELNEDTETLDLTGIPVTVEEVENLIAYLPKRGWICRTVGSITSKWTR